MQPSSQETWDGFAVGDPGRRAVGRAVVGSVLLGALFFVYVWTAKSIPALYVHEPWQDDPYDALISFELVGLPLLVAVCTVRVLLCRSRERLPARRAVDLLRGGQALVGLVAVTVAGEWLSVALGTHRAAWSGATVGVLAVLAGFTVAALVMATLLARGWRAARGHGSAPGQPDWLADAVVLAARLAGRLGPGRDPALAAVRWADGFAGSRVRRHPLLAAAGCALLLGVVADSPQVVLEGYPPIFAAYFVGVTACGLYAFFALGGGYLDVVQRPGAAPSPAATVGVVVCASVPLTAAFRNSLWWLVGADEQTGGLGALLALTVLVGAVAALLAFAGVRFRLAHHR